MEAAKHIPFKTFAERNVRVFKLNSVDGALEIILGVNSIRSKLQPSVTPELKRTWVFDVRQE